MYDVLTKAEVAAAEARAVTEYGLNEDILIESAAAALFESVTAKIERRDRVAVLAGGGKNGADGLSLARKLHLGGYRVTVFLTSERRSAPCEARATACKKLGVPLVTVQSPQDFEPDDFVLAADALLGTGLDRPTEGLIAAVIERLNDSDVFTLAVDLPSGIHADSGEVLGTAVIADETLTFCGVKAGHLLGEARNYVGNLVVADIGIPAAGSMKVCCGDDLRLPARKTVSHKYHYGRVRILAGSPELPGAAVLACEAATAALKSGAGLATLCVPESLSAAYQARVRESTLLLLPDQGGNIRFDPSALDRVCEKTTAVAMGMGMGDNDALPDIIAYLAAKFAGTLVLDADALNAVARKPQILTHGERKASVICTPHMGEFERLERAVAGDDRLPLHQRAVFVAKAYRAVLAVKSATTLITDGNEVFLNVTGTPALAKGGSGDVLAGMTAAFAARLTPLRAALTACYHLGRCGEVAARLYGEESVLAGQLIIR